MSNTSAATVERLIGVVNNLGAFTFARENLEFPLPYRLVGRDGEVGIDEMGKSSRLAVAAMTVCNPAAIDVARRIEGAHAALSETT